MAVPVTQVGILRALLQLEGNFTRLQKNMRNNAITWRSLALAQSIPINDYDVVIPIPPEQGGGSRIERRPGISTLMNSAAAAYQTRLAWVPVLQADPEWPRIAALYIAIGGTAAEFNALMTPLSAVADQLGPAPKTTYTEIIAACDQIIAAINPPLSLWPE